MYLHSQKIAKLCSITAHALKASWPANLWTFNRDILFFDIGKERRPKFGHNTQTMLSYQVLKQSCREHPSTCTYTHIHLYARLYIILLEYGLIACAVLEPDGVPDLLSKHHVHLIGHTLGHTHCCHSTRLSTTNHLLASHRLTHLCQPLGDL